MAGRRDDSRSRTGGKLLAHSSRTASLLPAIRRRLWNPEISASPVSVGSAVRGRGRRRRRPAPETEEAAGRTAFFARERARPMAKMRCDMPLLDAQRSLTLLAKHTARDAGHCRYRRESTSATITDGSTESHDGRHSTS